jgi:hypothetical protein
VTQPSEQAGSWLSGVDFAIQSPGADWTNPSSPPGGGAASGGGYSLAPEDAHNMLKQAESALDQLNRLRRDTDILKNVRPPAQDPASVAYNAKLANGSGAFDAGMAHVDTEIAGLNELIGKIKEAFKKITGHEPTAADEINQSSTEPGNTNTNAPKDGKY